MQIEIFERRTGTVVETQTIRDLGAFEFYWDRQANKVDYDYRVLKPAPAASSGTANA